MWSTRMARTMDGGAGKPEVGPLPRHPSSPTVSVSSSKSVSRSHWRRLLSWGNPSISSLSISIGELQVHPGASSWTVMDNIERRRTNHDETSRTSLCLLGGRSSGWGCCLRPLHGMLGPFLLSSTITGKAYKQSRLTTSRWVMQITILLQTGRGRLAWLLRYTLTLSPLISSTVTVACLGR